MTKTTTTKKKTKKAKKAKPGAMFTFATVKGASGHVVQIRRTADDQVVTVLGPFEKRSDANVNGAAWIDARLKRDAEIERTRSERALEVSRECDALFCKIDALKADRAELNARIKAHEKEIRALLKDLNDPQIPLDFTPTVADDPSDLELKHGRKTYKVSVEQTADSYFVATVKAKGSFQGVTAGAESRAEAIAQAKALARESLDAMPPAKPQKKTPLAVVNTGEATILS